MMVHAMINKQSKFKVQIVNQHKRDNVKFTTYMYECGFWSNCPYCFFYVIADRGRITQIINLHLKGVHPAHPQPLAMSLPGMDIIIY